jgi:hypothetical protein
MDEKELELLYRRTTALEIAFNKVSALVGGMAQLIATTNTMEVTCAECGVPIGGEKQTCAVKKCPCGYPAEAPETTD